jgi:hypothetical protein
VSTFFETFPYRVNETTGCVPRRARIRFCLLLPPPPPPPLPPPPPPLLTPHSPAPHLPRTQPH